MNNQTKFYRYIQNNSGGDFIVDTNLTRNVYIEANSIDEANKFAENLGVYFNGCDLGIDCFCCGDRWSEPQELIFPYTYGRLSKPEAEYIRDRYNVSIKLNVKNQNNKLCYDIIFNNVFKFAKFLVDKYGEDFVTYPDTYIYPLNGKKIKMFNKQPFKDKLENLINR